MFLGVGTEKLRELEEDFKPSSPLRIALRRLKRNRLAMAGLVTLGFLYLVCIFAEFLAPYPSTCYNKKKSYHPPTPVYIFDEKGRLCWPFVYNYEQIVTPDFRKIYVPKDYTHYPIKFFIKGEKYKFLGLIEWDVHLFGVQEPASLFLLGSDWNGGDILSRLIYGSRVSLTVGLIGVLISFFIGMIVGGISGYFGGWVDTILMRIVEVIMSFPAFYLMLALRAAFPVKLTSIQIYLLIVVIMSFVNWAGLARVIRGIVLSIREREYIVAAEATGSPSFRTILLHALPNTFSYAIVAATLSIPGYILGESALSLLGLGINEPQASWGNMLTKAMNLPDLVFHPWILTPGFLIFITVVAFNLLGDGLRDAFDPRHYR
jgi:peptide/nickel transport system permease protein